MTELLSPLTEEALTLLAELEAAAVTAPNPIPILLPFC